MKKMWIDFIIWLGFKYILNGNTGEVHYTSEVTRNCMVHRMADHNKHYITKRHFLKLHKEGIVDGCRWCMPEYNSKK